MTEGEIVEATAVEEPQFKPMTKDDLDAKFAAVRPTQPPAKRTKVAILGFTETWRLAPFTDPEWEIWGLNELYMFIPRWDRWFELHSRAVYEADKARISDHVERLKQMSCPVYMHQHWDDIPASVPYPLGDITRMLWDPAVGTAKPYFTNTISYMIALAIAEGHFNTIGVYGVDMAHDCLSPDMRVLTADLHWVRAGDLQVGQELMAFDEEGVAGVRTYRKATVQSMSHITRPCYRLQMADGTSLISSVGHMWLRPYYSDIAVWRRTDSLDPYHGGCRIVRADPPEARMLNPQVNVDVSLSEPIGEQPVIGLTTTTGTLIVEGFASHNSEYGSQKPSCEWLLGIAQGRGIKLVVPPQSDLLKTLFLYGFEETAATQYALKLDQRAKELNDKLAQLDNQIAQLTEARAQYRGAAQDNEYHKKNWKPIL